MKNGRIQDFSAYLQKLQITWGKKAVFHPRKVEHGMGRKVVDMYLAEKALIQVLLHDKTVDKGDADVFHDHFLYSIDRADLDLRLETVNILVVCMEDLHQVPVGVGIIFPENQPVAVQILEIDGPAGQRMLR